MDIIKSIDIRNYCSIISENIQLGDIITFVGANEAGKSNILKAIDHLEKGNQMKPFKPNELNLSVINSSNDTIQLSYKILLSKNIVPDLIKKIPALDQQEVILSKTGEPGKTPSWEIKISKLPKFGSLVLIEKNKVEFKKTLREADISQEWIDESINNMWFISGEDVNLTQNPFRSLIQKNIIKNLKDKAKDKKIGSIIKKEILGNIQVYFWEYDNSNYIKEYIPLEDFCNHPKNYKSVHGIFKIAKDEGVFSFNINTDDLTKKLLNTDGTSRANLLKSISKGFNKVFNKSWKTLWGKQIELKLRYEDNNLSFRFDDGSECPPEYRSDGFKWFLTFLINFQALQKSLADYVLLIDEPGGKLHPRGQKDALQFLNQLNQKNQILYSTHQTFLIDKNKPKNIRILNRKVRDKKHDFWPTKVETIENEYKHILNDSLLRESLGFTLTDISPISEENILVEGAFDRNLLQLMNKYFGILNMNNVSIIDCGRATNIQNHAEQYFQSELKVVCIYDNDKPGKKAYDQNDYKKKLISDEEGESIEDLLPEKILEEAYKYIRKEYSPLLREKRVIEKPFIEKTLKASFKDEIWNENKTEIKHRLEDYMLELVKKTPDENYCKFEELLASLKRFLAKK